MKKVLLTLALTAVCAASFAQGKITMGNNANHLIYFGGAVKAADSALAITAITQAVTPSGATFLIDLYGGTSAGTMVLQTTAPINVLAGGGGFGNINFISPNMPGGINGTFQVKVREVGFATAELAFANGGYSGFGQIFTFTPSSSIAFNSIVTGGSTTWANGTQVLPTGLGAIAVTVAPEPTSMALAGIGAAAMVIFRRRNK